ncbi:hypothetical protein FJTKL_03905 [Diaporthe vaccinii]|uniref:Uncharacterized protein n=1 Tax=Diaporthe vaccinii TaxID=105482 RepID=A0ABR4F1X7_9PEZI
MRSDQGPQEKKRKRGLDLGALSRLSLNRGRRKSWGTWAIQGSRNSLRADSPLFVPDFFSVHLCVSVASQLHPPPPGRTLNASSTSCSRHPAACTALDCFTTSPQIVCSWPLRELQLWSPSVSDDRDSHQGQNSG